MLLCLVCAGWLTKGPTVQAGDGRPKAVVTQTRFDLGSVYAGEVLIHVFSIRNDGTAPLTLLDKARDTEGRGGSGAVQPLVAYAGTTLYTIATLYAGATQQELRGTTAIAFASAAPDPVPT